ncbi:hypothetical protein [Flavobacterium sp. UBA7682]|uniref:hypothetical protein n=1 Tax=Flavobacterium sp. UBA7682 TaxID=1946560 RepID=UPI0025C36DFF|nr:hypothetical protein [Flavobacterium sp. UBA7682]
MLQFLKSLFAGEPLKQVKIIMDSKLGKLTCDYKSSDEYFSWDGKVKSKTKGVKSIALSIDGDLNGPYPVALQKAYQIVDTIPDLNYKVQQEIDLKFPEKQINLSRDFRLDDISIYFDEETNDADFDFEYYTEDNSIMVSVEFVNGAIETIDFY